MKKIPRISESEWEIMKVIWAKPSIGSNEIVEIISTQHDWHPKTIKTLLNRLLKKGALTFETQGRAYLYRPLVKESDCVKVVSESFLQRVFGGALQPMLAHFVEHQKLSPAEAKELKKLLDKKK